jgi:putative ABC transport system permease protein
VLELLRAAVRSLLRRRAGAAIIVLTLTVGIGANSAVFSAVDAVLLRPLPYPAADRLVSVHELNRGLKQATQLVAPGRLEEWNAATRTLEGLAGSYFENVTDTTSPTPERIEAMRTSPRFFTVMGVPAALGRTPTADEERAGGAPVLVISDAFWRRHFNGDAAVVGQRLILSGATRTIVGIMPPSFRYPTAATEIWIPAQAPTFLLRARQARFYAAVGRLKPGVSVEQAEADLTTIQTRLGEQYPETDQGWGASLTPLKEEQVGGVRRSIWLLFGAVALVLVAACGNVACLLLSDASRRQHEMAVRLAIGASRGSVVRQLLAEGLVLASAGASLGLLAAGWGTNLLRQRAAGIPRLDEIHADWRLLLFTATLGALTTLVFALAPALQASHADPADALGRGGRGQAGTSHRLQRALVTAQVALAIVLLVGAGLLIRSFTRLQQVPPGFDPAHVLTFRMSASWSEATTAVVARHARTIERLEQVPGVESAAISQTMPAGSDYPPVEFHIVGRDPARRTFATARSVSSGYFRALRIPILQGETCRNDTVAVAGGKALVTRAFADQFFPGESPIGHALTLPTGPAGLQTDIIGVVGDVHESGLAQAAGPLVYFCGYSPYWPDPFFVVRTADGRAVSVGEIRAALKDAEPHRAMYAVSPLIETLSLSMSRQRLSAILLALFAGTAALLAAMGLYGVMSQLVAARRREIGVRLALGARASQIVAAVAAQAAMVTLAGIVVGLAGAFALARFLSTLVFGISAHDPVTFGIVPIVLALVAAAAAFVPARRAATVDPMHALRED